MRSGTAAAEDADTAASCGDSGGDGGRRGGGGRGGWRVGRRGGRRGRRGERGADQADVRHAAAQPCAALRRPRRPACVRACRRVPALCATPPSAQHGKSTRDALLVSAGVAAAVAVYVVVHEHRRKSKKVQRARANEPIPKDTLLKILSRSAEAAKVVITKLRVEIGKMQAQRGLSDEQATMIFNQNFEVHLDRVIAEIRAQFGVTEKAMDASFKLHQGDADVKAAIHSMRVHRADGRRTAAAAAARRAPAAAAAAAARSGRSRCPPADAREAARDREVQQRHAEEGAAPGEGEDRARARRGRPAVDPAELSALRRRSRSRCSASTASPTAVLAAVEHCLRATTPPSRRCSSRSRAP